MSIKTACVKFAIWLARKCGTSLVVEPAYPCIPRPESAMMDTAMTYIAHVDAANEPWEWKQRQVLRALRNTFPNAKIRELNLTIEAALAERAAKK